jgi:hypothetical protein
MGAIPIDAAAGRAELFPETDADDPGSSPTFWCGDGIAGTDAAAPASVLASPTVRLRQTSVAPPAGHYWTIARTNYDRIGDVSAFLHRCPY